MPRRDSVLSKDIYTSIENPATTDRTKNGETYNSNTEPKNWYTRPFESRSEYEDTRDKALTYSYDSSGMLDPSSDEHASPLAPLLQSQNIRNPPSSTKSMEDIKLARLWSVYQRARSDFHAVTDATDRAPHQTSAAARFLRDSAENTLHYLKSSKGTEPIMVAELEGTYRMAKDVADSLAGGRKRKFDTIETKAKMKTKPQLAKPKVVDRRGSSVENHGMGNPMRRPSDVRGGGMSERINDNKGRYHEEEMLRPTRGGYDQREVREWHGGDRTRSYGGGTSDWRFSGYSDNTKDLRRSSGPATSHGHSNVAFRYSRRAVDSYQPR